MSSLLLSALLVSAQTKIVPQMKKGMKKTYVTEASISMESKQPVTVTCETIYEVTDETADGYILDVLISDVKTDAKNAESRIYSLATEMLKGIHTKYATDKDGQVTKVFQTDDVEKRVEGMLDKLLDGVSLPEGTTTSDMKRQLKEQVNEKNLLESLHIGTSPLALNGKTISTGTEEEYLNQSNLKGMKMKRIYTVNENGSITSSANINMDAEDISKLFSNMLDSFAPVEIDDSALAGLKSLFENANLQCSEQSTYSFAKDGWVKNITAEMKTSAMGMSMSMKSKVTQK